MFELLTAGIGRKADAIAAARLGVIAARAAEDPPEGVAVTGGGGAVILTGRGLRARFASDPSLRAWVREWAR